MLNLAAFKIISKRPTEKEKVMDWTRVSAGQINAATQRLWGAVGNNADEVATRINTDPEFVADIARLLVKCGFEPSASQKVAREVMGRNFFGIEEVMKHFGVNPTKVQLASLAEVPFGEEVLRSCKDTHILIAVFPLSILDIRTIGKKLFDQTLFYNQDWYDNQAFSRDKREVIWRLVCKEPLASSTSKTWDEQQTLLSRDEETLTAQIMIYTMVGHFLASGERLLEEICVRTSSLDSDGFRVCVGRFDAVGLNVYNYWDGNQSDCIGVSAARKPA